MMDNVERTYCDYETDDERAVADFITHKGKEAKTDSDIPKDGHTDGDSDEK